MNLYNIPAHKNCTNCGDCCGVIPASSAEIRKIREYIKEHGIKPHRTYALECPFRNEEQKKCDIYPVRPLICRLFGVVDPGKLEGCPNGNSANIDGKVFLKNIRGNHQILNFVDWEDEPLRCVQFDCFSNDDGICTSNSDYRAPDLGSECPEYGED